MNVMMNEEKVRMHQDEMDGFCIDCGEITHGGVEPDAIGRKCEFCGEEKVVGMETAILYDWIIVSESKTPMLDQYKDSK